MIEKLESLIERIAWRVIRKIHSRMLRRHGPRLMAILEAERKS